MGKPSRPGANTKDTSGITQKTITSRYVPPPNVTVNNARQSLEGGLRLAEAEAEGGHTLNISGEEKDADDNILHTFTATEEIRGGTITLVTTYHRPGKDGFTETVTTENGIPTRKEVIYPDKEAAAKKIKTETITYEESAESLFYPAKAKRLRAVYRDAAGEETKRDEPQDDGSILTTMRDKSTITTKTTGGEITKELVIHPSVTSIENGAFRENQLTSVTIGNGVKTIGDGAFRDNLLTSLKIPHSVTEIGEDAFRDNKLAEVILPKVLYNERGTAFDDNPEDLKFYEYDADKPGKKGAGLNADGSTFVTMPDGSTITTKDDGSRHLVIADGIETIRKGAFQSSRLTSVVIPPSVTEIGAYAFYNNKLAEIILPKELYNERGTAFYNNLEDRKFYEYDADKPGKKGAGLNADGLPFITMPDGSTIATGLDGSRHLVIADGIETIGAYAFQRSPLTSLTIPPSVTEIGKKAFERNQLTSLIIGNGVKAIGWGAFRDNKLTSLTIPSSVTEIGRVAFANNRLTSLIIGNGVKTIGDYAFYNNQLAEVILPKKLYEARGNAFSSNPKGLKFYEYDTDKTGKKGAGLNINADGPTFITMPNGSTITTEDDGSRHLVIADGIETIGKGAFQNSRLTSVVIPPSVTEIGRGAFWHNKLTSLTIGNGVKTIGWGAFRDNKLTSLTIPPSVTEIGKEAFANNRLTSLTIGNSVKTIGAYAFYNNQLAEVILPKELYEARGNAFGSNPKGLKFYEYDADKPGKKGAALNINADGSTFITMPDGSTITTKDDGSRHLVIADGIETIGKEAFANNRLTSVILSKALYEARGGAFNGNPAALQFRDRKGSALGTN